MNFKIIRLADIYMGIPLVYVLFALKKALFLNRLKEIKEIRNILLIKFWGIGNVIMLLPAAHSLKEKYPGVKIDFLTLDKNKFVSFDAGIFNNIFTLSNDNFFKFIFTTLKVLSALFKRNYDIVIDFEQFARFSTILCSLIGKKMTIGFNTGRQHRGFIYGNPVSYNNHIHMTKSFFTLAEAAGVAHKDQVNAIGITYSQRDFKDTEKLLSRFGFSKEDLLIILHIGTSDNFSLRRWPVANFAELANKLIDNYQAKIIFTGLAEEDGLVKEAIQSIKNKQNIIDTCGRLTFNQFVSMINLSDLVVSCDTSTVHIASCLSSPVVGLYGPNTPLLYGPWNEHSISFYKKLSCSPCITNYNAKINKCRNPEGLGACMKKISVEEIFMAIEDNYLKEKSRFQIIKKKIKC